MDRSTTFSTKTEALAIPAPVTKSHIEHWHSTDTCFGMRIMRPRAKDGTVARRWLARYYERGRDFRINLGSADRIGFDQARVAALTHRLDAQSRRQRGIVLAATFEEAYRDYKRRRSAKWSPDTLIDYEGKYDLLPTWFVRKRVDQVTSQDLNDVIVEIKQRIAQGKPKKPGKKPRRKSQDQTGDSSAVAAMNLVKTIFNAQKNLKDDPFEDLRKDGYFQRREPRSSQVTGAQLPAFWEWMHREAHPAVRDLLLCTLFMALRSSVAGTLKWENLVEDNGRYSYLMRPDQRGNKSRRLAPVPVPSYVAEKVIVPRLQSPTRHPIWIIESPKKAGHPLRSIRGSLAALKRRTKIDISLHDLRRTITSAVVRTNDLTTARRVLTHSLTAYEDRQATAGGYLVGDYDDLRRAMNRAVRYIRLRAEPKLVAERDPAVPESTPETLAFESELVDRAADEELLQEILKVDQFDE
jgi:hypothetical protein